MPDTVRIFPTRNGAAAWSRNGGRGVFILPERDPSTVPAGDRRPMPAPPRRRRLDCLETVKALRPRRAVCVYDRDLDRLLATLLELKHVTAPITNRGQWNQHAFLTGWPAERAVRWAEAIAAAGKPGSP